MTEDEKKRLKQRFTLWRSINWALVSLLVIRAICALTWLLPSTPKIAVRILVAIAIMAYSTINIFSWAEQTQKDMQRLSSGTRLTLISAAIILGCRIIRCLCVAMGIVTVSANLWGVLVVYTLLAGGLCFSLDKEKQMTDAKMSKVRTPPKRTHKKGKLGDVDIEFEEWVG